jgi:TetR/AcrR family transcriptional repressor of nem operon
MNKGSLTREAIIEKAAELFNVKGYASGSLSELMKLTGLQKGGIYNHFQNKEEIAIEAFAYSVKKIGKALQNTIELQKTPLEKLYAILSFYENYAMNPIIKGGCPILNMTTEVDDTNPLLKQKVQKAITLSIQFLAALIEEGIQKGDFKPTASPQELATILFASIEGGIVLTRAFGQEKYIQILMAQLRHWIQEELLP